MEDWLNEHLGVEDAGVWLNNTDSLVECLQSKRCPFLILNNGGEVEFEVLWLQNCGEAVTNAFLSAGRYRNIESRSCKILHDLVTLAT